MHFSDVAGIAQRYAVVDFEHEVGVTAFGKTPMVGSDVFSSATKRTLMLVPVPHAQAPEIQAIPFQGL